MPTSFGISLALATGSPGMLTLLAQDHHPTILSLKDATPCIPLAFRFPGRCVSPALASAGQKHVQELRCLPTTCISSRVPAALSQAKYNLHRDGLAPAASSGDSFWPHGARPSEDRARESPPSSTLPTPASRFQHLPQAGHFPGRCYLFPRKVSSLPLKIYNK